VVELHSDEGDQKMIKCFTFGKEKREKQNPMEIKAKLLLGFGFSDQDTIEGVITFRIDSHTIKRGISGAIDHLSATR
jgi:hypothetical protein